jgi:uncharacterized protein (DUF427 family)
MGLFEPSPTAARFRIKGRRFTGTSEPGGQSLRRLAWSCREPIPECPKIEKLVCFFNERVDTFVDGEKMPAPRTHRSR